MKLKDGVNIPGLKEGGIPQGLTYSSKYNVLIMTSYFKINHPSSLYIIDYESGNLIKKVKLLNKNKSNYKGHVGGIATNNDKVWITSHYDVIELSLDEIMESNEVVIKNKTKLDNSASIANYSNDILWIGEYDYKFYYKTKEHHHFKNNRSLLFGYKDENIDFNKPDYVISIPNRVQGFVQDKLGNMYFSRSFWSFQRSKLTVYKNILEGKTDGIYKIGNNEIPLYILSKEDKIDNIYMLPMSEGITLVDEEINVLFESAAKVYKWYTLFNTDKIKKYKIKD